METDLRTEATPRVTGARRAEFIIFAIAVVLAGLLIGGTHLLVFFSHHFHGDASSNYVLATAIADEYNPIPLDFYFSTQISVLKSQAFIAIFILLGIDGYVGYALGSAISLALWLLIFYVFMAATLRSAPLGLLLTLILAIPLNHLDSDFVLAQQSHLASVVLSIAAVVSTHRYATERGRSWLAALAISLFAMTAESPARAALVAVPIAIAAVLAAPRQALRAICAAILGSLAAGYAVNKILISHWSVGRDFLEIATVANGDQLLDGLAVVARQFWNELTSLNVLASASPPSVSILFLYGISLAFLVLILAYYMGALCEFWSRLSSVMLGARLHGSEAGEPLNEPLATLKLTASTGLIVGVLAMVSLNPDSIRHVLWAIVALKLCLFMAYFRALSKRFRGPLMPALLTLATCLLLSHWAANVAVSRFGPRDPDPFTVAIKKAAKRHGITHVYGSDFWTMMPLNTYIPRISAGVLIQVGDLIGPLQWLARPSWACVDGDVLYVIEADRGVDEAILAAVRERPGAEKVAETGSTQIWLGKPVWTIPAGVDCGREPPAP